MCFLGIQMLVCFQRENICFFPQAKKKLTGLTREHEALFSFVEKNKHICTEKEKQKVTFFCIGDNAGILKYWTAMKQYILITLINLQSVTPKQWWIPRVILLTYKDNLI